MHGYQAIARITGDVPMTAISLVRFARLTGTKAINSDPATRDGSGPTHKRRALIPGRE
jgi:hypothetical protein